MGQKVNPTSFRIGIIRGWDSMWFANKKNYAKLLHQDLAIRKIVKKELANCGVSQVEIHRNANSVSVYIHSSKPGVIIGRQGKNIDKLKELLEKTFKDKFTLSIKEIKQPDLDAYLVGENIARQIESRMPYRRVVKSSIGKIMDAGGIGAKVLVSGRLNGVEIARREYFSQGKIPLHTFRADIDYALVPAFTAYGAIGVKVWIYRGEVFKKKSPVATVTSNQ